MSTLAGERAGQASTKKLCFGLKKSKAEPIDHVVSFNYEKVDMPEKFNLKDRVKQIHDQQNLNACSANATASLLSLEYRIQILTLVDCIYISVHDGLITI